MDASTAKDRFTVIWIHPIPAQLSIQEFSAKMEAQVDSLLALSSAQNNLLRYDLIIPNNKLDSYYKAIGFPDPQPVVLGKIECESAEHCAQFLRDADAMKNISTAQEFAGASIFSVNVVTKIDAGSADGSEGCIGIFKCPPHLSRTQFHEFVNNKVSNGFVALPTVQKNIVKGEMIQDDTIEKDVRAIGIPAAETVAVVIVQAMWTDDGLRQFYAGVDKAVTNEYSNRFSVDIVNKLDRVRKQIFVSVRTAGQEFEYSPANPWMEKTSLEEFKFKRRCMPPHVRFPSREVRPAESPSTFDPAEIFDPAPLTYQFDQLRRRVSSCRDTDPAPRSIARGKDVEGVSDYADVACDPVYIHKCQVSEAITLRPQLTSRDPVHARDWPPLPLPPAQIPHTRACAGRARISPPWHDLAHGESNHVAADGRRGGRDESGVGDREQLQRVLRARMVDLALSRRWGSAEDHRSAWWTAAAAGAGDVGVGVALGCAQPHASSGEDSAWWWRMRMR
ncbi:hypothetical protein B0H13DRAFT_1933976 [Mycena leptocephala]|nr:hypothetical protein B0H13DRAFT_1933976 [Mycena leptocephala]